MKKEYISPDAELVTFVTNHIIAATLEQGGGGGQIGDDDGNGEIEEATNEARGDWDNIWNGM